jgi:hypothetical protein
MKKHLFVLFTCLFVVMIGLGITMPVLPFYVERLALAEGATRQSVVMHIGLLTGVYAHRCGCFTRRVFWEASYPRQHCRFQQLTLPT